MTDEVRIVYGERKLKSRCRYWQKRLGLSDWKIVCKFVKATRFGTERQEASCDPMPEQRRATIEILDPKEWGEREDGTLQNLEQTLVHELLHVVFASLNVKWESSQGILLEQNIDWLATLLEGYDRITTSYMRLAKSKKKR